MNTYSKWLSAIALTAIASVASAAVITATPITSNWNNSVGQAKANIVENVSFGRGNAGDTGDGEGFNQARWGTPFLASSTAGRSGLGFKSKDPVTGIVIETPFNLGSYAALQLDHCARLIRFRKPVGCRLQSRYRRRCTGPIQPHHTFDGK